jgi:hypothetical protein
LPRLCRGRCPQRTSVNPPIAIEILDDAGGVFVGITQAGQLAIDELVLGAVDI